MMTAKHPGKGRFPGYLVCPISAELPVRACTFDNPGNDGMTSPHVFEYTEIFRHIATKSTLTATRNVRHPVTGAAIQCGQALQCVHPVSQQVQHRIHQEHLRHGVNLEESNPLNLADYTCYNQMIANVLNP